MLRAADGIRPPNGIPSWCVIGFRGLGRVGCPSCQHCRKATPALGFGQNANGWLLTCTGQQCGVTSEGMTDGHLQDHSVITARLREQAQTDRLRITVHGHQEMMEEGVSVGEVRDVLLRATMVENYPDHKRGPCCLVCGQGLRGRNIHVVCTTSLELAIIITVYEPKPPKWVSAFERGGTK